METWEHRGLHGSTDSGARSILRDRRVRGSRLDARGERGGVYCGAVMNPKEPDEVYELFCGMKGHGRNLAKALFEVQVVCKKKHKGMKNGGADAEAKAILEEGFQVAHMKRRDVSKWVIDEEWAQLVALWVQPDALEAAPARQQMFAL